VQKKLRIILKDQVHASASLMAALSMTTL